jgi:uncharacterized protein (TIGR00299 family) protein
MKKAVIFDPFSGASGDMFLGALVDLGVPFDALRDTLGAIPELGAVSIEREAVTRGVFAATRIKITCPEETAHRSLSTIRAIIEKADLTDQIKTGAIDTFTRLASAEAKVHGSDIEKVHFHEVGALDAIADIVGAHVALGHLGNPDCFVRTIIVGSGTITGAHGDMPVPAPATLELLSGLPVSFTEAGEELVTPTGAALIASIAQPLSTGTRVVPDKIGYGAGGRDRKGLPNVLRVVSGAIDESQGHVCIVTSTLDDMNPEVYGYVMEQLFANGALEVYYNPVNMKKNRPGVEVTLISEEHNVYDLANLLLSNTTTIGVRIHREERLELERRKETVETTHGTIEIKVAARPGGGELVSPEYESCKRAAQASGVSLLDIYEAARRAWDKKSND